MKKLCFLTVFLMSMISAFAQSAIVPMGGTILSTVGSVSFTMGEVATQSAVSEDNAFSVTEGVQQPYEILTVGVDYYSEIMLNALVYPNPTEDLLRLDLNGFEIPQPGLKAILYDEQGRLLQQIDVMNNVSDLQIGQYAIGSYLLILQSNGQTLKTFKILKR